MSCTSGISYIVNVGDSLYAIAAQQLGDGNRWPEIKNADGTFPNPNQLQPGQELCLPGAPAPGGNSSQVIVYDDSQYQGFAQVLDIGQYDWGQIHNDAISSLRVPPGMKVTLYEDTYFQGKSKTFTQDTPYVGDDFNDLTSSIIVENDVISGGSGFANFVSNKTYALLFPNRNALYTYGSLITAVQQYPQFCNEGSLEQQKREAAAFLAHISHETGRLVYVEEQNPQSTYCDTSNTTYPYVPGKSYHGRGPLQLSWNYNYGACGNAIGKDLLNQPELVSTDSFITYMSALWFWMTPQSPKPSCHTAINISGFGMTINIINGGIECGKGEQTPQALNRIQLYQQYAAVLGVNPGTNLYC
jgi:predicted chitinase